MYIHKPISCHPKQVNDIRFWFVYVIALVYSFQSLLIAFTSSTYMARFVSPSQVGMLYSLAALGSVIFFLLFPFLLQRYGNVITTLGIMVITILSLAVSGLSITPTLTITAFVLYLTLSPLPYLSIDIFSETLIGKNEKATGSKRGLALSLMGVAGIFAPLTMGFIVGNGDNFSRLFFLSIVVGIVFMIIVVAGFHRFSDQLYHRTALRTGWHEWWFRPDIKIVFLAHFLLQLFFTWAIIYVPLYLASEVGMNWQNIGYVISVGLLAYVLFEYPIGIMADRYTGEKEMMALGFLLLALTSASVSYMVGFGVVGWMVLMFLSRIGASLVEATTESYFFKKVRGEDANLMSLFRILRPLANLVGALLGSLALLFLPLQLIFLVLGLVMTIGIFITLFLHDTK